ncbi:MAG: hypothetical protein HKP48_08615 [Winogradskyella sp.]|uniref:TlpA family protein disulfide reductase n=1 Tax=Winogradskyella sp. TaxID=1883156 RepID=UPI00182D2506|nr:hypothetical protein [Winogradskyella sp.]MBT8243887.1 hypothetical protein [Winogradskyella sp.]NNK23336.1 hypothetical protein [Winogradskyella sp.]
MTSSHKIVIINEASLEVLNLKANKNSYLAVNYPNAEFYKELNLKTIPRYLLFDTNGKLIYNNAPSPSSDNIRKVINDAITK